MKEQLLKAWTLNHQMNALVLENLTENAMNATLSNRGGRTIKQQWIHIHNVRHQWLELCAKDLATCKPIDKADIPDNKSLLKSLDESAKSMAGLLIRSWDEGGKLKNFKSGLIPFLGYLIAHEAHHRGNILLTLKQVGEKIPDKVKWGIWEWGK